MFSWKFSHDLTTIITIFLCTNFNLANMCSRKFISNHKILQKFEKNENMCYPSPRIYFSKNMIFPNMCSRKFISNHQILQKWRILQIFVGSSKIFRGLICAKLGEWGDMCKFPFYEIVWPSHKRWVISVSLHINCSITAR